MASLTKDGRILFKATDGKRKTLRLGTKTPKKQSQLIQRHVERLIACQLDGSAPPEETSRWLAGGSTTLHERLERVGLVAAAKQKHVTTLAELVDEFKSRPRWQKIKPRTRLFQGLGFRYLLEYFGAELPISELTEAKAEDYHSYLQLPKAKGGRGLAVSTGNRECGVAWMLYRYAIRSRYLDRNPFDDVPKGVPRTDCNVFVGVADCEKVLAELSESQWRLLFALSRWGGLRTPSEQRRLRWCDIDWEKDKFLVHSSKTEHHVGHETRWVPIFPELAPILAERFEDASDGDELVLPMMQSFTDSAFSHRITRLMDRIGVERWARLFHSMRSTRQTELERVWPTHVVCYWLGNSTMIARRHYLMTTDEDFAKAAHNPTQQVPAEGGTERKTDSTPIEKSPVLHGRA